MEGELIAAILSLCILVFLCLPWVASVIRSLCRREPWRLGLKVVGVYSLAIFLGMSRKHLERSGGCWSSIIPRLRSSKSYVSPT